MKRILLILFALILIGVSVSAVGADGDFPIPLQPDSAAPVSEFAGDLIDESPSMPAGPSYCI